MWIIKKLIKEQPDNASIGLLLGNQSSQWFALLYLNKIDHYIKEQLGIKCYVRYMDDMVLAHKDKKYLSECKNKIAKVCNIFLDLDINEKIQIGMVKNGIDFLGYRHILNSSDKIIIKLRYSSKKRLKKHLRTLNKLHNKEIVDDEYVNIRKNSFYNHIKDTNGNVRLKVDTFPFK